MKTVLAAFSFILAMAAVPAYAADEVEVTPRQDVQPDPVAKEDEGDSWLGDVLRNTHGSVGAMIASDGTRAVYGVANMPLSDNADLTIAFSTGRYGESYYYDRYHDGRYRDGRVRVDPMGERPFFENPPAGRRP